MLPRLVLLTDRSGRVVDANGPARALLGGCVGKRWADLFRRTEAPQPDDTAGPTDWTSAGTAEANGVIGPLWSTSVGDVHLIVLEPRGVRRNSQVRLTPRQVDVLRLVARGMTDPEIAAELKLGRATVRTHIEGVRRQLGVKTRSQAVARALELGILP